MDLNKIKNLNYWLIIHLLIGGGICFFIILAFDGLIWMAVEWTLKTSNLLGAFVFEEAQNGYYIIRLGALYLVSGFLSGLYTGYQIKEKLKINMIFPSITGFAFLMAFRYFSGYLGISNVEVFLRAILMPLIVTTSGVYLGGYTLNWHIEEESEEEKITLIMKGE